MDVMNKSNETKYTPPTGKTIKIKESIKDLGVYMSNECLFEVQINTIIHSISNYNSSGLLNPVLEISVILDKNVFGIQKVCPWDDSRTIGCLSLKC